MSPVNVNAISAYLREQGEQARASIRQLAQAAGVANPNLTQQIARGLRVSADALYIQAGILEEKEDGTPVTEAIMADPEITDRQKQMLTDIYESFLREVRADAAARAAAAAQAGDPPGQPDPGIAAVRETEEAAEAEEAEEAVGDAIAESRHDPVVEVVAAAEAEPWTEPPAPHASR